MKESASVHPLRVKVRQLRSRLRQLLWVYGVGWTLTAAVGMVLVLGAADFLFRWHDLGMRVLGSLGLLTVTAAVLYRCLWRPLSAPMSEADIALRLKCEFPELGEQLACALEFLDRTDNEPAAGSAVLRRAVIDRVWSRAERLDFRTALTPRVPLLAAASAAAVCLLAGVLAVMDPLSAQLALARLANPLAARAWPRQTHLEIRDVVRRVARGQAFEVEVVNRGKARLPEDLQMEYRFMSADGTSSVQIEPMRRRGATAAVARRERVNRPFAYRAVGGDDRAMPWIEVDVVEPPGIDGVGLQLSPPAYTGYGPFASEAHLRALKGTALSIVGRATKPVASVTLHLEGQSPVSAKIDLEGMQFRIPAPGQPEPRIEATGTYWFVIVDREGIVAESPHWEVQALSDSPPSAVIEQPSASLFVTPGAVVPVRVSAKDNLAIRRICLVWRVAGGESERSAAGEEIVFRGPSIASVPAGQGPSPLDNPGDHRTADLQWSLEPLDLQPGQQLLLTAAAEDYQPLSSESPAVRLSIISPRELEDRIAAQQDLILAELRRALETQRRGRSMVRELEARIGEAQRIDRSDIDHVQAAELIQRQVERELTAERESVPGYVAALLADLENNRVDNPDIRRRMQALVATIDDLRRDDLPAIRQKLMAAVKAAQIGAGPDETPLVDPTPEAGRPADPEVVRSLQAGGQFQDRVIEALEGALQDLGRGDDYRRFYRDMSQLAREQEALETRAAELGGRTLGREPRDLPSADLASLRALSASQLDLARRLDRMSAEMDQAVRDLDAADPLAADAVALAVDEIRRQAISDLMRTGGSQLTQNRMGQAAASQRRAAEAMHDVLNILANRREHELERLADRLREAEAELTELGMRQGEVEAAFREIRREQTAGRMDAAEAGRRLQPLAGLQTQLADAAARAARRLGYLQARAASQSTRQAGNHMGTASDAARDGRSIEGDEHAGRARQLLEQARREIAAHRRQMQAELAAEHLARLEDAVAQLYQSQKKVVEETTRIHGEADSPDGFTRPLLAHLQELIALQQSLRDDTERLSRGLLGGAGQLVLRGAAEHMAEVVARLRRQDVAKETQAAALLAATRLAMLLESFQTDPAESSQAPAGGGEGPAGEASSASEPLPAAEVKLIKLLQQDINRRTAELAASLGAGREPSKSQLAALDALVSEQGQLADLTTSLLLDAAGREPVLPSPPEPVHGEDMP